MSINALATRLPWFQRTRWIIALLILVPFAGALLVWRYRPTWSKALRIALYVWAVFGTLIWIGKLSPTGSATSTAPSTPVATQQAVATAQVAVSATSAPATAKPVAVPEYEWVGSAPTSLPARLRYKTDIVMPGTYSDEQTSAVFADAVRRTFREHGTAKAAVVFGYSSRDQVQIMADKGRALASQDGMGWTGDRTFSTFLPAPAPDQGEVYVTLGMGGGPERQLAVAP